MSADSRIEAYSLDYCLRVESLDLGVGVELVEIADAEGEVGVGEELHGLGLLHAHEQCGDVLLDRALLKKRCECAGRTVEFFEVGNREDCSIFFCKTLVSNDFWYADNDTRGIEIVVERL